MRMPRTLVWPAIGAILALLPLGPTEPAAAEDQRSLFDGLEYSVASGAADEGWGTATLDGTLGAGEWSGAAVYDFKANLPAIDGGGTTDASLFLMNDSQNLYMAVRVRHTGTTNPGFEFDNNNDARYDDGDDAFGASAGFYPWGKYVDFRDAYRYYSPGYLYGPGDTSGGGTVDGTAGATSDGTWITLEISHPLDSSDDAHDFSLAGGDIVGFWMNLRLFSVDYRNNQSLADTRFPLRDFTPPTLTPPSDVTVECAGPSGTEVELGSPTVSDNRDRSPTVTNDAPSLFPLGTTTVTWTATDRLNNRSLATQRVTVRDTTAPVITAPADVTVECTSPSGQAVSLGAPTVQDAGDGSPSVTNDAPALFTLGTTTVTWTVTDASGNTSRASQVVTIRDTTAPALTVSGLPSELWPPNHQMVLIRPEVMASDAGDASATVTLRVTSSEPDDGLGDGDTSGDVVVRSARDFDLRAERSGAGSGRVYTLVWTATDASGNSSTFTATVTVPKSQGKSK